MPNFSDDPRIDIALPTTDKDGNAITEQNPLELEDIPVRIIESTDPVLGLRANVSLDDPTKSPYNYPLLGLLQRDIYLNQRIDDVLTALANQNITVADATETVKGIIEIANTGEANALADLKRAITPFLLGQVIRGTAGAASTTRRGTSERATDSESAAAKDTETHVTPSGLRAFIRGAIAAATTTYKGAVERLTNAEGRLGTDTTRYPSIATVLDALRNGLPFRASKTQYGVTKLVENRTEAIDVNEEDKVLTPASLYGPAITLSSVIQSITGRSENEARVRRTGTTWGILSIIQPRLYITVYTLSWQPFDVTVTLTGTGIRTWSIEATTAGDNINITRSGNQIRLRGRPNSGSIFAGELNPNEGQRHLFRFRGTTTETEITGTS